MVMIFTSKSGEQYFFFIRHIVSVLIGIYYKVGSAGYYHLITYYCYTKRRYKTGILNKQFCRIRNAVFIGILQDHYTIALGMMKKLCGIIIKIPVVHRFGYPHPSFRIYVNIGRIVKHGRFGPQRSFKIIGQIKRDISLGLFTGRSTAAGKQQCHKGNGGSRKKFHL